jgi:hypothetical protein
MEMVDASYMRARVKSIQKGDVAAKKRWDDQRGWQDSTWNYQTSYPCDFSEVPHAKPNVNWRIDDIIGPVRIGNWPVSLLAIYFPDAFSRLRYTSCKNQSEL